MTKKSADYEVFNVGSGKPITIIQIAEKLAELLGKDIKPSITNQFRKGDVRHCFSDISKISKLGFEPKVSFDKGLKELIKMDLKTLKKTYSERESEPDMAYEFWEPKDKKYIVVE